MVRDPEDAKLPLLAGQKSINTTRDVIIVTLCHRIYSRGKEMICGIFNAAAGKASGWWDRALPGSALSSRGQKWEKRKNKLKKRREKCHWAGWGHQTLPGASPQSHSALCSGRGEVGKGSEKDNFHFINNFIARVGRRSNGNNPRGAGFKNYPQTAVPAPPQGGRI